jgi:hypothetical protein
MGILDNELRLHLKRVTQEFEANRGHWISNYQPAAISDSVGRSAEQIAERKSAAEKFREEGNFLMKSQQYLQALHMYSESIAAAIEGPLASLGYFNRYNSHYKLTRLNAFLRLY